MTEWEVFCFCWKKAKENLKFLKKLVLPFPKVYDFREMEQPGSWGEKLDTPR